MRALKLLVGGLIIFLSLPGFAQELKIGYIDSQKILANYKEAIDARKKLDAEISKWRKQAEDMQRELRQLQDQLESQSLLLSEETRIAKNRELQEKYAKYQQFLQEKLFGPQAEAYKREAELMQPIYDKINAVIHKIGEEEKFDYIFDIGSLLYAAKDQYDLTDRVLEELNKGVAKGK